MRWRGQPAALLALLLGLASRGFGLLSSRAREYRASLARAGPAGSGTAEQTAEQDVAIIMSGIAERWLISSFLSNVLDANKDSHTIMDFFFSVVDTSEVQDDATFFAGESNEVGNMAPENSSRYTPDPKLMPFLTGHSDDLKRLLTAICKWASASGANICKGNIESGRMKHLPDDEMHRNMIFRYNPLETRTGQRLLNRWHSMKALWKQAVAIERIRKKQYDTVLVVRDDTYFGAPYHLYAKDLAANSLMLKTVPCMESYGFNDKLMHMGRDAAVAVMGAYQEWMNGNETTLNNTRNAEEFLFRLAELRGVHLKPSGVPMNLATFTTSGLPCFRKQNFTLKGGYHPCFGEETEDDPHTKFFHTFSCSTYPPQFYDILSDRNISHLHQVLKKLAGPTRKPLIMTVTDKAMVDLAGNMRRSLVASGEDAGCLVVGTQVGVCAELGDPSTVDFACIEFPLERHTEQQEEINYNTGGYYDIVVFKHALITLTMFSDITQGILFTDPDTVYLKPPMAWIKSYSKKYHAVFSANNALVEKPESCSDVLSKYKEKGSGLPNLLMSRAGTHVDINTGLMYLKNTPLVADMLLRAWMIMDENKNNHKFQQWSMLRALKVSPWIKVGVLPCDHFVHGNSFWGHNKVLDKEKIYSVHTNWMYAEQKRACLDRARLWVPRHARGHYHGSWWDSEQTDIRGDVDESGIVRNCPQDQADK